jgi:serine/threonine protein kinase
MLMNVRPCSRSYYGSFYSRKREEMNLVVEIVLGGSLTEYIRESGSFSDVVCAHVLHQLLEGLHFLHSNDILHRDIKPGRRPFFFSAM